MENNKKIIIQGTKKQRILLGLQIFIIIFMIAFAIIARHIIKIDDTIISNIIFICVIIVVVLMNIISLSERDSGEKDKFKE